MRAYRESFSEEGGRRGLTQEQLLRRMGAVDSEYAQRFSHATVSRWESGATRPTVQRLRVFGMALNLSADEIAGLLLLAGLAPDFQVASDRTALERGGDAIDEEATLDQGKGIAKQNGAGATIFEVVSSILERTFLFGFFRCLLLGVIIVLIGFALPFLGWDDMRMPVVYVGVVSALVLAKGFLLPGRGTELMEFYCASLFILLSTPLIQFAPIRMDHYNFYTLGSLAGTPAPYTLALLANLALASAAVIMFQLAWRWQHTGKAGGSSALRRAVWVVLPPTAFVYAVIVVITNVSVSIQLAVLLPILAAAFTILLVLRNPTINPSEQDRRFLLWTTMVAAMVSTALGIITILAIYVSPDLPMVLPDHNLLNSWDINFAELGYSREEALERLNLGYMWHAMCMFAYMFFVIGGNLIVSIYRMRVGNGRNTAANPSGRAVQNPGVPVDDRHQAA